MEGLSQIPIKSVSDIVKARQEGRRLAEQIGFSSTDVTLIVTAISELARNIVLYAGEGEIVLTPVHRSAKRGLTVVARDNGPGIPDVTLALQDGYSTSGGLGLGLPGVRRLMDEFQIESEVGSGTAVTVRKWCRTARH